MRYATKGGWNCHQFHANSEFYSNHSVYDVKITLPKEYVVGAGGMQMAEVSSEGAAFRTGIIATSIFLLFLPILLLVADYARAWQASHEKNACFKAINFGFSRTFRTFFSSYPLMVILLIVQFLYGWFVLSIVPGMKPVTGGGVVLLFILSQLLFFIKILLKGWRYGSVTKLMEINNYPPIPSDIKSSSPQGVI